MDGHAETLAYKILVIEFACLSKNFGHARAFRTGASGVSRHGREIEAFVSVLPNFPQRASELFSAGWFGFRFSAELCHGSLVCPARFMLFGVAQL